MARCYTSATVQYFQATPTACASIEGGVLLVRHFASLLIEPLQKRLHEWINAVVVLHIDVHCVPQNVTFYFLNNYVKN